jgi:IgA Peptidase M64
MTKIGFTPKIVNKIVSITVSFLILLGLLNLGGVSGRAEISQDLESNLPVQTSEVTLDPLKLKPLINNEMADKAKDRINLIFAFSDEFTQIELEVTKVNLIESLELVGESTNSNEFGLFATEPFKSNKSKFNLWYYDQQFNQSDNFNLQNELKTKNNIFGIEYTNLIYIENKLERISASFPDIEYDTNFQITTYNPGPIISFRDDSVLVQDPSVLTHELGHSLFGLADEYVESDQLQPRIKYPNCAENQTQAQAWWGDLIGEVDPFFYEWRDVMMNKFYINENGRYFNEYLDFETNELIRVEVFAEDVYSTDNIVTKYAQGGCFTPSYMGQVRPTENSIMGYNYLTQVFGSVNRRQAEKVLNIFSGTNIPNPKPNYPAYERPELISEDLDPANCIIEIKGGKQYLNCTIGLKKDFNADSVIGFDIFSIPNECVGGAGSLNENIIKPSAGGDGCGLAVYLGENNTCLVNLNQIVCDPILVDGQDFNVKFYANLFYKNNLISIGLEGGDPSYFLKLSELQVINTDKSPTNTNLDGILVGENKILKGNLSVEKQTINNKEEQILNFTGLRDTEGNILPNYPITVKIIDANKKVTEYLAYTDQNGNFRFSTLINTSINGASTFNAFIEVTGLNGTWTSNAVTWDVNNSEKSKNNSSAILVRSGAKLVNANLHLLILTLVAGIYLKIKETAK